MGVADHLTPFGMAAEKILHLIGLDKNGLPNVIFGTSGFQLPTFCAHFGDGAVTAGVLEIPSREGS